MAGHVIEDLRAFRMMKGENVGDRRDSGMTHRSV